MSITEAIKELERQRDIAIEQGLNPDQVSVLIPAPENPDDDCRWDELGDMGMGATERGTMFDLYLKS